jgi:hypothetical protein
MIRLKTKEVYGIGILVIFWHRKGFTSLNWKAFCLMTPGQTIFHVAAFWQMILHLYILQRGII